MTKKHFIALADCIRTYQEAKYRADDSEKREPYLLDVLADFCEQQNPRFKRDRWLAYIKGECGTNGAKVKKAA